MSNLFYQLYQEILYLLSITVSTDALWIVIPLAIATILMVIYFGIYREERAGWNTHLSNSFVLVFVSIALLRHIYLINSGTYYNFIDSWDKTLLTIILLSAGITLVRFNFGHVLPERFAKYLSSPLTINLIAYVIILLVYSEKELSFMLILGSIIIILVFMALLILIKKPMYKIAEYIKKQKRKERLKNVKEAKHQIDELKRDLKSREKELKKLQFKEAEQEKKEAISIKKAIKKK